jgi:hypothetical protein
MKRLTEYTITPESMKAMRGGIGHSYQEITFIESEFAYSFRIFSGPEDDIYVFRDSKKTCVICSNRRLDYVMLQAFHGTQLTTNILIQGCNAKELLDMGDCISPEAIIQSIGRHTM